MTIGTDTLAADNFNRSNGALGGSTMSDGVNTWTTLSGSPTVASNKQSGAGSARVTSNSNFANANYSVQAEQYMKGDASYAADGVNGELYLYARVVDANNYYEAHIYSNGASNGSLNVFINKVVAGTPTTLVSTSYDDDGFTTWRFDVDGTSLRVYGDGTPRTDTATDSTFTGVGYAGIASTGPVGTFASDNFIVKGTAAGGGSDYDITGSVSTAVTPAASFNFTNNASIAGAVSLALTVAASSMSYESAGNYSITGSVPVAISVAAAFDSTRSFAISGSVPLSLSVASAMDYSAVGNSLSNPQATMTYNGWSSLTIDVSVS